MGKAGRIACIFTPWALTIASLVCLVMVELAGWNSGMETSLYFFEADFTNLTVSSASTLDNTTTLTLALEAAKSEDLLESVYQIHLWNYCSASSSNGTIDACSKRQSEYYFDPVEVWGLNSTTVTSATSTTTSSDNAVESKISTLKNSTEALETEILGKSGREALDAYKHVAKWMFIAYEVSFWTTLATILCGILAIFSRWGSLLTWLFSVVSTIFTFGAVLTSTVLFSVLVASLKALLDPYGVKVTLGTHALVVCWLAVVFSMGATFFWLFSICCCSGRSNPHHKSNKGGLWNAEQKGQGYGDFERGRGLQVQKTGGYERVGSPYMGAGEDQVPLQQYPQETGHATVPNTGAFEPYRHT
ncbi:hypothetical protein LTR36_001391 [Oleoguttula mirabilis]|uniref:Integral membrane protein n=1 Tax=Oleoguttula mirabilis TaxID=1507867 RepID=A0AAV9JPT0_9PEZI|nr:hypothetical protein LTR36_001391 [Oleoguttula mirabilis]